MSDHILWKLLIVFIPFSMVSFGGGGSVLPGIEDYFVSGGMLSSQMFTELFAVSRFAPGPGSMLVTLIGWQLAGWQGAIAATLAFFVPSTLLCIAFVTLAKIFRQRPFFLILENALAPLGTGLILSAVIVILRISNAGVSGIMTALGVFVIALQWTRPHPFLFMAAAAVVFWLFAWLTQG